MPKLLKGFKDFVITATNNEEEDDHDGEERRNSPNLNANAYATIIGRMIFSICSTNIKNVRDFRTEFIGKMGLNRTSEEEIVLKESEE